MEWVVEVAVDDIGDILLGPVPPLEADETSPVLAPGVGMAVVVLESGYGGLLLDIVTAGGTAGVSESDEDMAPNPEDMAVEFMLDVIFVSGGEIGPAALGCDTTGPLDTPGLITPVPLAGSTELVFVKGYGAESPEPELRIDCPDGKEEVPTAVPLVRGPPAGAVLELMFA